jgi:hypothetical protein
VQSLGVAAWLDDRPDEVVAIADAIDDRVDPFLTADAGFAHTVAFLGALAAIAGDDRELATTVVQQHAVGALAGRIGHAESDALVLLAELARREGDVERARELIRGVTVPRGQASTLAATRLAWRLGVGTEFEREYRANYQDLTWVFDLPKRTLLDELTRRGWAR